MQLVRAGASQQLKNVLLVGFGEPAQQRFDEFVVIVHTQPLRMLAVAGSGLVQLGPGGGCVVNRALTIADLFLEAERGNGPARSELIRPAAKAGSTRHGSAPGPRAQLPDVGSVSPVRTR